MWFRNRFNTLKTGGPRHPVPTNRRRLTVEALDDRSVPASLAVSDVSILEGNSGTRNAVVTVTLTGSSNPTVSVNYRTANGTAVAGSDYQVVSGTLTFNKGATSKTILIPVTGDTVPEPDETFVVNLTNAKHATIADGRGVVTIVNDDARVSIGDATLAEGNAGSTNFNFPVNLSVAISQPVTVTYATADGSATGGSDFVPASGTLMIPAGETEGTITVAVNGDRESEPDETFLVNLSGPINAVLADGQGVGTVLDDEPHINVFGPTGAEGSAGPTDFTFTVTLSTASDLPVTVDYTTADDTATAADADYVPSSGTLTFAPGETSRTIPVPVNGDSVVEYDESFIVNLTNPTNAQLDGSQAWATILSDDNAVIHIDSWYDYEPDPNYETERVFVFTVWLSAPSSETVTVDFNTTDGSAIAWSDYLPAGGTLTFAPGETSKTIEVIVLPDWEFESEETFYVGLDGASTNALIQPGWNTGFGVIFDNTYWW